VEDRLMTNAPFSASPSRLDREESHAFIGLIALFVTTAAWWLLALWPVDGAPAWLERTRYVCFGVAENGLPDAGGWIGLTAGPLGMLSILLAGWSAGVKGLLRRTRTSRPVAATLIALALGVMVLVTGAAVRVQQALADPAWLEDGSGVPPSTYPRLDRDAPPLVLTDQYGGTFELGSLRGRPVLVTFAYAHCATICPVIVMHSLKAQEALRGTSHDPAVVVLTLDPWRDPPSRLPNMARQWGLPDEGAWILSGAVEDVEAALDAWDVPRSRNEMTGEVTHPSLIYVLDRDGRLAYASTGGIDALVSLVERLDR
jgi:cytochrome oxidase Cu insertion factor (SCO1/SenC/PrrC family)